MVDETLTRQAMEIGEDNRKHLQVCRINVTFPVTTDSEALAVKQSLQKSLTDIPDVQIMFTIISASSIPTIR
jgi:hypothetical protein